MHICLTKSRSAYIHHFMGQTNGNTAENQFNSDSLKIYVNWIQTKISLKIVPKGQINNIPALLQIMAWCQSGNKPLSETMMLSLLTHICIPRPQWVDEMNVLIRGMVLALIISSQIVWENYIINCVTNGSCCFLHAKRIQLPMHGFRIL